MHTLEMYTYDLVFTLGFFLGSAATGLAIGLYQKYYSKDGAV